MQSILDSLHACNLTAAEFVISLLTDRQYENEPRNDMAERAADIIDVFLKLPVAQDKLSQLRTAHNQTVYLQEMQDLANETSGWHFGASSMTTKDLETFRIEEMARQMETGAPGLWSLLGLLQGEDETRRAVRESEESEDVVIDEPDDEAYWDELDPLELEGFFEGLTRSPRKQKSSADRRSERRTAIRTMVSPSLCRDSFPLQIKLTCNRKRSSSSVY